MEYDCLRLAEVPHTTRIYSAFVEDFRKVNEFYGHPPSFAGVCASARKAGVEEQTRRSVSAILREQNHGLGNDSVAERNIERLGNGAVAIVTGQQTGLFTGPAYSIYKALSAIHWAAELTSAGMDAVPVFWMATEDHDLEEVNQAYWSVRGGLERFELPVAEEFIGRSVGRIPLGKQAGAAVDRAVELLEGRNAADLGRILEETYRGGETFGSAFGKLMARLFAGRGLILLDPLERRFHEMARPVYKKAAEHASQISTALAERNKKLEARGFHAQVKVTRQSTLLFCEVQGVRQAVRSRGAEFMAGSRKMSPNELLHEIEERPEIISANVLLRPVLQDTILPTAAYVAGPAEVAYFAQGQVVYRQLDVRMPAIVPRASFTLVEEEIGRLLEKYKFEMTDVWRGREHLRRRMELKNVPRSVQTRFVRDEKKFRALLEAYRRPLNKLDKTLGGALDTAERKMMYQFGKLQGKAGRARNFRDGVLDRHEASLLESLYPHRGLQERSQCLLPYLARHGMDLFDELLRAMRKSCSGHVVIKL